MGGENPENAPRVEKSRAGGFNYSLLRRHDDVRVVVAPVDALTSPQVLSTAPAVATELHLRVQWRLTTGSFIDGQPRDTPGNVELLLSPRQSRGISRWIKARRSGRHYWLFARRLRGSQHGGVTTRSVQNSTLSAWRAGGRLWSDGTDPTPSRGRAVLPGNVARRGFALG